jgi:starvation-inducible DNA-binding protein
MKSDIGLKPDDAKGVAHILNEILADEYVLYTKTRNYHWNVVGPDFAALHKFFEKQYEQLSDIVDDVAERARSLCHHAVATLGDFVESTNLDEEPGIPDSGTMIENLARDHETIIRSLRNDVRTCTEKYKDDGTANFLTDVMEKHEKMAWMLRAHVESRIEARTD